MSHAQQFEPIPVTPPHPPRCPRPRVAAGVRRRRLRRARGVLIAYPIANRCQAQLQGVALAMIAYMARHWCEPGRGYDFDRWSRIVDYYTRALGTPELAGNQPQAREALAKILDQNQVPPSLL